MEVKRESGCPEQDGVRCKCTKALVRLNKLRERNLLCDAVLRSDDDGVFPVHRVILSMGSEYFRTLFTTKLHTTEETDILLHGVSTDMMKQILDYVYFGEVDIRSDNACRLFETADYLCIPDVPKLCCDFLKDKMAVDNSIGILQFARFHFCDDLETHARGFVQDHFMEVSQQSEELLELPVEELQAIIESDELAVEDEKFVWECILRWINHDPDNRKGHINSLLKGVSLGLLDKKYFVEKVSVHPYVTENVACRPVISETLKILDDAKRLSKDDKDRVTPRIARPRNRREILFAIGGYDGKGDSDVIEAYDARADRWTVVEGVDSIGPRSYHGTAVVGFDIYVIGGWGDRGMLSSCRCFNAVTKTCREVAPMHERRCCLSVAVLRGSVFAMGGEPLPDLRTAERYDCKTNQWSLIAPMNTGRSGAGAAVLNDKIYVAGGKDAKNCLNSVEVYDPDTDRWTFVAPMHSRRWFLSCVAFHGLLYALGGINKRSEKDSTEKYDPAEDTWTEISGMDCYSDCTEVIDDMIFVMYRYYQQGGRHCNLACFNDKENRWDKAADMNVPRRHMSTCVIENLPNASDYEYKHKEKSMEEKCKKNVGFGM